MPEVPVPDKAPDGLPVIVHEPAGKPLKGTLALALVQVGWVGVPGVGADGSGLTVIVPVAFTVPQPPVNGME